VTGAGSGMRPRPGAGPRATASRGVRGYLSALGPDAGHVLDDGTWNDLAMDDIFDLVDGTTTTAGRAFLYAALRAPLFDVGELERRRAEAAALLSDAGELARVRKPLRKAARDDEVDVFGFLGEDAGRGAWKKFVYPLLAAAEIAASILWAFTGLPGFLAFLAVTCNNIVVHYLEKMRLAERSAVLSAFHRVLVSGRRILGSRMRRFARERAVLADRLPRLRKLMRKTAFFIPRGTAVDILQMFMEYVNMTLLLEAIACVFSLRECVARREDLLEIWRAVGAVDALSGAAARARERGMASVPDYAPGEARIRAAAVVHPALAHPVPNPASLQPPGFVLTGANMSGKSTYLRAVAVNQILAQSVALVFAREYSCGLFRVVSSMSRADDLGRGDSLYLAEGRRVLAILTMAERDGPPVLAFLDEVFSGTNSPERVAITVALLETLAERKAVSLLATHDLEIPLRMGIGYECLHLRDSVSGEGLAFDFKLEQGIVTERNAAKLLRLLGYPAGMLDRIRYG
jgi:DNA mismatch repair ATPase MutS